MLSSVVGEGRHEHWWLLWESLLLYSLLMGRLWLQDLAISLAAVLLGEH
jgi:hypothetical protein